MLLRLTNDRDRRARNWRRFVPAVQSGWHPAFWLAVATLVSFVVRIPLFGLPMIADEGGYAYVAQRWFDGRGTLYSNIWVSRPQGIFVAYGAIFHTLGTSVEALRLGAWLVCVATMPLIWFFAERWSNRSTAALAVVLFAALSGSPAIEGFTANAEVFMALPSAIGIAALLRASETRWSRRWLVLAGTMAALATLLKPSGIVILLVGVAFVGIIGSEDNATFFRRSGWIGAGFGLGMAPALINGYLVGWSNFVYAAFSYRMFQQSGMQKGPFYQLSAIHDMAGRGWPVMALALIPPALILLRQGLAITVSGWFERLSEAGRAGIVARRFERPALPAGGEIDLLLRLWLVGCLAGIALGGDWWNHYLIQILAPLSIWVAAHALDARRWLSHRGNIAVAVILAFLVLLPYRDALGKSNAQASADIFYHSGYADQEAVAAYLDAHSPEDAQIYAAFNEPALYYLADRASAYRYLFNQELQAIPDSEAQLVTILSSTRRPMYVIGTKQDSPYDDQGDAFWNAVSVYYHLEAIVHGVPIFRADPTIAHRQLLP